MENTGNVTRRQLLGTTLAVGAARLVPTASPALAQGAPSSGAARSLPARGGFVVRA